MLWYNIFNNREVSTYMKIELYKDLLSTFDFGFPTEKENMSEVIEKNEYELLIKYKDLLKDNFTSRLSSHLRKVSVMKVPAGIECVESRSSGIWFSFGLESKLFGPYKGSTLPELKEHIQNFLDSRETILGKAEELLLSKQTYSAYCKEQFDLRLVSELYNTKQHNLFTDLMQDFYGLVNKDWFINLETKVVEAKYTNHCSIYLTAGESKSVVKINGKNYFDLEEFGRLNTQEFKEVVKKSFLELKSDILREKAIVVRDTINKSEYRPLKRLSVCHIIREMNKYPYVRIDSNSLETFVPISILPKDYGMLLKAMDLFFALTNRNRFFWEEMKVITFYDIPSDIKKQYDISKGWISINITEEQIQELFCAVEDYKETIEFIVNSRIYPETDLCSNMSMSLMWSALKGTFKLGAARYFPDIQKHNIERDRSFYCSLKSFIKVDERTENPIYLEKYVFRLGKSEKPVTICYENKEPISYNRFLKQQRKHLKDENRTVVVYTNRK